MSCSDCAYWKEVDPKNLLYPYDEKAGQCRRHAPTSSSGWAVTVASAWCGDYKAVEVGDGTAWLNQ